MDSSSNSQHSDHPVSGSGNSDSGSRTNSGSGSGNQDSDDSGSRIHSGSGGSTGETSPSANSSMQTNTSSGGDQPEQIDDMDVDTHTTSTKLQTEPSTGKDKEVVVDPAATASSSSTREGKAEEIGLLTDLYTLNNKTGRYVFSGSNDKRDFYKFWIQEEGEYANKEELDNKINELHARFLKNMDKNVEAPTDPVDVEILRLSHWIWGDEIDSSDQGTSDDQD